MKRNRRLDNLSAALRRIARILRQEWKNLPPSYHVGLWSFALLLLELLAALVVSLLRGMGIPVQLSQSAVIVIVVVTFAIAAVSMISLLIGMVALSFTKRSDHNKRLFPKENPTAETARQNWEASPPPPSPLDLPYQEEVSVIRENLRFLFVLLLLWLWASWMLFGRGWFADGSIGERRFSIFFALWGMALASMEAIRVIRRLYDRLLYYRTPFKGLKGESEDGKKK